MRVTMLGSGASTGVPLIGCGCVVCTSDNPKNKRTRVSLLVEFDDGFRLLVDTSPDLRQQALRHGLRSVDAIIYTHTHADHTHGVDDVRGFNIQRDAVIDAYMTAGDAAEMQNRFGYILAPCEGGKLEYWPRAALNPHIISAGDVLRLSKEATVQTFRQHHGKIESLGLRFGNVVYSTDVHAFPDESLPHLQGMDLWILGCLREGFAGAHANLDVAREWVATHKPAHTVLTHMNHEMDYDALRAKLPPHIEPGYDGWSITLP